MVNNRCLNLILTFDVCSNFDGIEDAASLILKELRGIKDSFGEEIKFTWFVRADNQLKTIYGDATYLLERYNSLWRDLKKDRDEIGWHPHIYYLDAGKWKLETLDDPLETKLIESHEAITKYFDVSSARMGEGFHSTKSMSVLDKLGIKVDSTALPNRKRADSERFFDWIGTPEHPYHPSKNDYRIPGKDELNILEVPMSTIRMKTSYDVTPLNRYVNLSFYNSLMNDGIKELVKTKDIIVTITHPYEVLSYSKGHSLLSFDINEAEKNLFNIIKACKEINRAYKFITMSDVPNIKERSNEK